MSAQLSFFEDDRPTSLSEAREWLRDRVDKGAECPCCTQFAKVYRRSIHARMARDLITTAAAGGWDAKEWVEVGPVVGRTSPDLVKLVYWGMLDRQIGTRDDGSDRVGWWRLTNLGLAWVRNERRVQKYARIYDGRCLGLIGEPISIVDALGDRFDYRELMNS